MHDSCEGRRPDQQHNALFDQDTHTFPTHHLGRAQDQNEVSMRNLAHNYSEKSVPRLSTTQSQRLVGNNYSIAEEALGFFNQGSHVCKASRVDRATNTSKLDLSTPRRSKKRR